ncbi:MAG: hypothetical protein ACFB12_06730 [Leptolyngbyaceae cyanobacterium]
MTAAGSSGYCKRLGKPAIAADCGAMKEPLPPAQTSQDLFF